MAYEIKWTFPAAESHELIVSYLEKEWSEREVKKFINTVNEKLQLIAIFPELFLKTNKRKNIHRALIGKQTVLYYRVRKQEKRIELMLFWDSRRNPQSLKSNLR